jgi:hypothetical protein
VTQTKQPPINPERFNVTIPFCATGSGKTRSIGDLFDFDHVNMSAGGETLL